MTDDGADTVEHVTPSKASLRRRLQQMDPYDFEAFVGDVWEHLGWKTRVVGEAGDRETEVVATDGDAKQLRQAKWYGPNTPLRNRSYAILY